MKKALIALATLAMVAGLASCQRSHPAEEGKGTINVSISGLMGEYIQVDGTKAFLVDNVRGSWEGGETVYVYDGTQCLGSLAASLEGNDDRCALLSTDGGSHTIKKPVEGTTKLTLVYSPLLTAAPSVSEGGISISLDGQDGPKAPFVAYATLNYNNEETITNAVVPFKFASSVIKINCTGLKANTAIASARLSNVNTACRLSLSGTAAPTVSGDANGTITRTGDAYFEASKVNEEGVAIFHITVPELGTSFEARVLKVAQGSDNFWYRNFPKKSLVAAASFNIVCQFSPYVPVASVSLDRTSVERFPDGTVTLYATVLPENASDRSVIWTSDRPDIATVDKSGMVSAKAVGTATVTVTTTDVGKAATCTVNVRPLPPGVLPGVFTVSAEGKQICFSRGNLQATYNSSTSTYTWDFAANQYDCIGKNAGNTTIDNQTNGAVVDLFGWSTLATNYGISTRTYKGAYSGDFVDWGKAYCTSKGISEGTWRTLSAAEWCYLLAYDPVEEEYIKTSPRYNLFKSSVTVCNKANCVVIAPDGWDLTKNPLKEEYTFSEWSTAEAAGLVCLPAAGYRYGSDVYNAGGSGSYWSSSAFGEENAYIVYFFIGLYPYSQSDRVNGRSVRLIMECR